MYNKKILHVTIVGSIVNILLAIVKITIGFFAHSQALVADGVHSFSDLITDGAIIIGSKHWSAPPDESHPYGHGRLETLVTLFIGGMIGAVSIGIVWRAIATIWTPHELQLGWSVLLVALISIISKEILYRWTIKKGKIFQSKAIIANAKHHRSDAISSIPVALAVVGKYFFPNLNYLDNVASFFITAMLLKVSWDIIWPSLRELMEASSEKGLEEKILSEKERFSNIDEIHKIRSRRMGGVILVDLHMQVDPKMSVEDAHKLAGKFKNHIIEKEKDIMEVLIHIEPFVK